MAVIDWNQFNDNFQYYDKSIILEVINIFFDEYDERIAKMQKNIDDNDLNGLAFNAHSLKSVIANYMAPMAYEHTRKLEELAKNGTGENIPEVFASLKSTTQELIVELKEYVQKMN